MINVTKLQLSFAFLLNNIINLITLELKRVCDFK